MKPKLPPKPPPKVETLLKYDFEKLASHTSKIAEGYVFVPKGDVYVTRHCRLLTEKLGKTLYVVYNNVTHARLGLNCPTEVYDEVKIKATASAASRREAVSVKDLKDSKTAQDAILRLFPQIPLVSCRAVLDHAYEKGTGRVGRTGTIDDDEKVTLAIIAYIRHSMTPYDQLLQDLADQGINEAARKGRARGMVRARIDEVLSQWRAPGAIADPSKPRKRSGRSPRRKSPIQTGSKLHPGYVSPRKTIERHKQRERAKKRKGGDSAKTIRSPSPSCTLPGKPYLATSVTANNLSLLASMYAFTPTLKTNMDPKAAFIRPCSEASSEESFHTAESVPSPRAKIDISTNIIKPPLTRNSLMNSIHAVNANIGPRNTAEKDSRAAPFPTSAPARQIIDISTNVNKPPLTRNPLMDSIFATNANTAVQNLASKDSLAAGYPAKPLPLNAAKRRKKKRERRRNRHLKHVGGMSLSKSCPITGHPLRTIPILSVPSLHNIPNLNSIAWPHLGHEDIPVGRSVTNTHNYPLLQDFEWPHLGFESLSAGVDAIELDDEL